MRDLETIIRGMRKDDVNAVAQIYLDTWRVAYAGIINETFLSMLQSDGWAAYFNALLDGEQYEKQACVLQAAPGELLAAASFSRQTQFIPDPSCAELISLYLLPEYWGLGYGQRMMRYITDVMKGWGATRCCLWVLKENMRAIKAYERFGFKAHGDAGTIQIAQQEHMQQLYVLDFAEHFADKKTDCGQNSSVFE